GHQVEVLNAPISGKSMEVRSKEPTIPPCRSVI
ncbi:hypothetical protein SOVF_173420, partial [Spinacia oleracea]